MRDEERWYPGKMVDRLLERKAKRRPFFDVVEDPTSEFLKELKDKYGFIPVSTWLISPQERTYRDQEIVDLTIPLERIDFTHSSTGYRYSILEPEIVRRVLSYYSDEYDLFLDPFYGWGEKMLVSLDMNRNYIGFDVQVRTIERGKVLLRKYGKYVDVNASIYLEDGTEIKRVVDEVNRTGEPTVDIIFASPPYYKVEIYGEEKEQLSHLDYPDFLRAMKRGAENYYWALKPGKFCIMAVGDFRYMERVEKDPEHTRGKYKIFTSYHSDIIEVFKMAGFELHDIIVLIKPISEPTMAYSAWTVERRKNTIKIHEYLIVFRKPVKPYHQYSVCEMYDGGKQ